MTGDQGRQPEATPQHSEREHQQRATRRAEGRTGGAAQRGTWRGGFVPFWLVLPVYFGLIALTGFLIESNWPGGFVSWIVEAAGLFICWLVTAAVMIPSSANAR